MLRKECSTTKVRRETHFGLSLTFRHKALRASSSECQKALATFRPLALIRKLEGFFCLSAAPSEKPIIRADVAINKNKISCY